MGVGTVSGGWAGGIAKSAIMPFGNKTAALSSKTPAHRDSVLAVAVASLGMVKYPPPCKLEFYCFSTAGGGGPIG